MTLKEITPELVLVDPDLRRQLMHAMSVAFEAPNGATQPAARPPAVLRLPARRQGARPAGQHGKPSRGDMIRLVAAGSLVVLGVLATVGIVSLVQKPDGTSVASAIDTPASPRPDPRPIAPQSRPPSSVTDAVTRPAATPRPATARERPSQKPEPVAQRVIGRPATAPPAAPPSVPSLVRRFAWAPVTGAGAYLVELRRGGELVFSRRTAATTLTIPKRWRFAGKQQSLRPGRYVWYVWPLLDGKRGGQASVRSTLAIG